MARPKRDPYLYQINGNYWAFFNRDDRRSLNTRNPVTAAENFGKILQGYGLREVQKREKSFSEIVKITFDRSTVSNSQKSAYENGLNLQRILNWLETIQINKSCNITKDVIEKYKAFRITDGEVGAARVNRELVSWKNALRVAVEFKEANKEILNCFETLPEPKPNPQRKVHTREALQSFLELIDMRYLPLMKLTLGSGIRDDEARHFLPHNLKQFQRDNKDYYQLTITPLNPGQCDCCPRGWNTKNYRYRTIPISKETFHYAQLFCEIRKEYNLQKKTSQRTVWGAMQKACDKAKIESISLHDLRHTCASYWIDAGFKPATVQGWLGHSSLEVTLRYIHGIDLELPDTAELPF